MDECACKLSLMLQVPGHLQSSMQFQEEAVSKPGKPNNTSEAFGLSD